MPRLDQDSLQISVSDTGVGLPTQKIGQIFEAFFTPSRKAVVWVGDQSLDY